MNCLFLKNAKCAGVGITGFMWQDPSYLNDSNFRMADVWDVHCLIPFPLPWQT